ncbi:MAG: class I SAM-dependent methyltransferase [Caldilineaceae bacterium]|nr:class I SAM-dependent methyltransferase [Caldilineaceae bacterium]
MNFPTISPEFDNLAEYVDPELYDVENAHFEPDGPFFLQLAQEVDGPVLELGCGTGRLGIPLLQQGIDYTGLDPMPQMLEHARRKARELPAQWIEADARSFQLGGQYQLIFDNGAAFVHVRERADHEAILACVREHLAPNGRFVLAIHMMQPTAMQDRDERVWFSYVDHLGQDVTVSGTERFEVATQIFHEDAIRRWHGADGQEVRRLAPLARRIFFPPEVDALLHYNGFTVVERYGDWDRSPLTNESPRMIFVATKR